MIRRLLKDHIWLGVAFEISKLGTCSRRNVGVVFLNAHGHVIATGYNGTAPGAYHCTNVPCAGAHCPSGTGLELCEAIHAEQNAIAQCRAPQEIDTVYCTDSPCIHCVKMLATTSARRIVFGREYPHSASEAYWKRHGGVWEHLPTGIPSWALTSPPRASQVSFWGSLRELAVRFWRSF